MTMLPPRRRPWLKMLVAAVLLAIFAAACGGDDSDDASGPTDTGDGAATTDPGTPVAGGEATILQLSEIGTLDPVAMTGSAGSDGLRAFALYGALVAYDSDTDGTVPVLAESFTPSEDFRTWTLVLKPGLTFSDGSPFDAEAVKVNWERAKDPANRSPALSTIAQATEITVVDETTLTATLAAPNAHWDNAVARVSLNYIASAKAIQDGTDLTSNAIGAGPFLLDEWLRDDRMVLVKNPDWKGSDGPFLDKITIRVIGEETQRADTFITGAADAFYTVTPASIASAEDAVKGAHYVGIDITTPQTYVFNTSKPPFDDARIRKAFVLGVDWQAMVSTVFGEGAQTNTHFTVEGTTWHTEDAVLPEYDPDEAQRLIDEYVEEKGGPVRITVLSFQQAIDQARGKFIQASLSQLDNIEITTEVNDSPTNIQKVLAGEYETASWGFPTLDPEPGLYNAAFSQSRNNYSRYNNAEVDAALLQARETEDVEVRKALYQDVFRQLAEDLPFFPYLKNQNGYVVSPDLHGAELYEDGILRLDLLWKS